MDTRSAILNTYYNNISNIGIEKEMNNERIKKKLELRQKDINNILYSARKMKSDDSVNKNEEKMINIQMLKDMNIPTDFEINTFKYYENVIFL